jgi:hypothetical protein
MFYNKVYFCRPFINPFEEVVKKKILDKAEREVIIALV